MVRARIRGGRAFLKQRGTLAVLAALTCGLAATVLPGISSPARATGPTLPDFGPSSRWVSYGHTLPQPTAVTAADMAILKAYGATGIMTYTTIPGYDDAAEVAISLGMKVILGIDNPADRVEDAAAVALAEAFPSSVQGIVVGNEGLCFSRYTFDQLDSAMGWIRSQLGAGIALTTAEPLQVFQAAYYGSSSYDTNCNSGVFPGLLQLGDFISVNDRPPGCDAQSGAQYIASELSWLQSVTGKFAVGHEVVQMTDPWCSQADQRDFFCALRSYTNSFSHFTAFDETGGDPDMAYGGLFTSSRSPKLAGLALSGC